MGPESITKGVTKMKKTLVIVIGIMVLMFAFAACTAASSDDESTGNNIPDIIATICKDVDLPAYEVVKLDKATFESFAFAPYQDVYTAYQADALVNISAHSLVVIHSDDGGTKDLAETIQSNAALNKWLCVFAESGKVLYTDHYVVLMMSTTDAVDQMAQNFQGMTGALDDGTITVLELSDNNFMTPN